MGRTATANQTSYAAGNAAQRVGTSTLGGDPLDHDGKPLE